MGKKQEESPRWGGGAVLFFLAVLSCLIAAYPWLLLFPIVFWLCFIRPGTTEEARRRPPLQAAAPAPRAAMAPCWTAAAAPPRKFIRPQAPAAPPDFIPKDREYNRYLARTWDEEFEALVRKLEHVPPA